MKVAVITALAGISNASIRDPSKKFNGVDYYAFSNKSFNLDIWNKIELSNFSLIDKTFRDRRHAKLPKILGSFLVPGYDFYIWHDHTHEVIVDPYKMISEIVQDKDMALFKHPNRTCVYAEIDAVLRSKKDSDKTLKEVRNYLLNQKFAKNGGLFEMGAFVYRNTPKVQTMMLSWWEHICKYSSRDQISFPFVRHRHGITYNLIPGSVGEYAGNNDFIRQIKTKKS